MKNNGDLCRIGLCFHLDNEKEEKAYNFLQLLDRQKTSYLTNLVLNDLVSRGIFDISALTKEDAKQIVKLPSATAAQINLSSVMLGLLQNNFKIPEVTNASTEKTTEIVEAQNKKTVTSVNTTVFTKDETEPVPENPQYEKREEFVAIEPKKNLMSKENDDLLDEVLDILGDAFGS